MFHSFAALCTFLVSLLSVSAQKVTLPPYVFQSSPYINATFTNSTGVDLRIWTKNGTRNNTAPHLSGLLFEDFRHSGDGGLYAELVRNRAFQGSGVSFGSAAPDTQGVEIFSAENPICPFAPVMDGWYAVGKGVNISLDLLHPLSDALQVSLQVSIPLDATGEVGFKNDGWWGMGVTPQTYNVSFYAHANGFRWNYTITHFEASLRSNTTGEVYASTTIPAGGSKGPFTYMYTNFSGQIVNTVTAPTSNNSLYITMSGEELRGQTLYFDLISLFPETYKNRPNGLRKDLAEYVEAGNYKFLRFPGGNNLEGMSIARRWKWWETIGPLKDRPGRIGDWSYFNTDGLGLLEFMYWCEDMDLVPLLDIYAGFSLDIFNYNFGNASDADELPVAFMGPILQEALDELEYLMGDVSTYWGSRRASDGHPEPFDIPFVEIGNEDFVSFDYPARAAFMYNGLKAKYPNITYIYTAADVPPESPKHFNISIPPGVFWDQHLYLTPSYFVENFNFWDNFQQDYKYPGVLGAITEYQVANIDSRPNDPTFNPADTKVNHPRMLSAVAEAVYYMGLERNPNEVKLAAFAPGLQNANVWNNVPYLALFTANPNQTLLSTSYYQEVMFNAHKGTQTLPTSIAKGQYNPLFWVATIDGPSNSIYFKVVNAGNTTQKLDLTIDVPFSSVNGTILKPSKPGDLNAFNFYNNRTANVARPIPGLQRYASKNGRFSGWKVPAYSVAVLQFDLLQGYGYKEKRSDVPQISRVEQMKAHFEARGQVLM